MQKIASFVVLLFFFIVGLGVVAGAELNAALAEPGALALRGERYEGPYSEQLRIGDPDPEEEIDRSRQAADK